MKSAMKLETLFDEQDENPEVAFSPVEVITWDPRQWRWKAVLKREWKRYLKIIVLMIGWGVFTAVLIISPHHELSQFMEFVPSGEARSFWIPDEICMTQLSVTLLGSFYPPFSKTDNETKWLTVTLEVVTIKSERYDDVMKDTSNITTEDVNNTQVISSEWKIPLVPEDPDIMYSDHPLPVTRSQMMQFNDDHVLPFPAHSLLRIQMVTDKSSPLAVVLKYDVSPIDGTYSIIYAAAVLFGLYVLIVFDIVHHTLAAMLMSTMAIAALAAVGQRPTMDVIVSWIDVETLLLLFSMMILVAILTKTGIFDYLAVLAFKLSHGRVWALVIILCIFTALLNAVIDSVTTVLLLTPVVIRLCQVLKLNPVPMLMSMMLYSNIGGAMTPVGNPPNVIIASNPDIIAAGVDFTTFFIHMGAGVLLVSIVTMLLLKFVFYRKSSAFHFEETQEMEDLRHELAIWRRTYSAVSHFTGDEVALRHELGKHVTDLEHELTSRRGSNASTITGLGQRAYRTSMVLQLLAETPSEYNKVLADLKKKYPIKDPELLLKSGLAISLAIFLFFIHSVVEIHLSIGWTALIAALLLLAIAEHEDMDRVLAHVEWATLLFFAALFVLMEALSALGLIAWIGGQVEILVLKVDKEHQLTVAMMLILWVSALASAFIDNIPLTTVMIKIVTGMAKNPELRLPQQPLVWAVAFGACLGGNGTIIGSSANVVCVGVAEQHGYEITFLQFSKVGLPIMLSSVIVASCYLLLCHSVGSWHL